MTEAQARKALVDAGRRLADEGLVARSWGNLSVRVGKTMLVTPSGIPWSEVTEAMMAVVDLETGEWTGDWKPSGERKVHREIYRRRPEVHAVAHTHQNAASACAATRLPVPTRTGLVPCAPYALPGTKKLTVGTVDALGAGPAVLMANHGVFTVGADLTEAFLRITTLERDCAEHLAARARKPLPARADAAWDPKWLTLVKLKDGSSAMLSAAPFTVAWTLKRLPLPAVLDDLAQLAGKQVKWRADLPQSAPANDVVLAAARGAVVCGDDAEALAMVVEKAARAMLGGEGLGGARPFPAWEAVLMRWVYKNAYSKQAKKGG